MHIQLNKVTLAIVLGIALITIAPGSAFAKKNLKAHEHGAVKLSIAIDANQVAISGEIPGVDAFGFEHAAHNDQEKKKIKDALAIFRNQGTELFQFAAEAGCTVKEAVIKAPMEASLTAPPAAAPTSPKGKNAPEEHQDVDADYTFSCQKSPVGGSLKIGLFTKFPSIRTVTVQVISGAKQSGQTVKGADEKIAL